jgi:hypothetical protein
MGYWQKGTILIQSIHKSKKKREYSKILYEVKKERNYEQISKKFLRTFY